MFEFKPVSPAETEKAVRRAFAFLEKEQGISVSFEDTVPAYIASAACGDVRKAINAVELCTMAASPAADGSLYVTEETARQLTQHSVLRFDRSGDEHYDIISAYQKSMRGSDPDAALHYLARLLEAGDLPSACRRLLVCASEDVGLANPSILPIVKAAVDIALQVGLPEAQLPLADAVILVAQSPKSNTGHNAILAARADVQAGKGGPIPRALQNKHFDGADAAQKGQFYLYPHDYPHRWVKQQYLPDALKDAVYYVPGDNKNEQAYAAYWRTIRDGEKH